VGGCKRGWGCGIRGGSALSCSALEPPFVEEFEYAWGWSSLAPRALDIDRAMEIAEEYLAQQKADSAPQRSLFKEQTIERDFGWTFFYGPRDTSVF
jgi:hypothetical protein